MANVLQRAGESVKREVGLSQADVSLVHRENLRVVNLRPFTSERRHEKVPANSDDASRAFGLGSSEKENG